MKKIAIVTGASSGIGKEFAESLKHNIVLDEVWVIARTKKNLEKLNLCIPTKVIDMDLTDEKSFSKFETLLEEEKPNIKLLINASGFGKFEKTTKVSMEDNIGMIKLNCEALTRMCLLCIPYMKKDTHIINIASVAAYQPIPYINIYGATKSYVLNFSRALNVELKKEGIHVMAVCPYWTKTAFFDRAVTENKVVKKYIAMYNPKDIVKRAWKDLSKNKDVSKYGFIARGQVFLCQLLPHKLVMNVWLKQQKLN